MSQHPIIEITDLSTDADTPRGRLNIVDNVSLSVRPGETLGIVGESGSGKTILMRSLLGLLPKNVSIRPGSNISFDGRSLLGPKAEKVSRLWGKEIALIPQDPMTSLNPVRRIGAQLTDGLRKHAGMSSGAARERAVELLRQVGIADAETRLDVYPHEMSGGMRQRVLIAMAISLKPKLLIADEPTTALDVTIQRQILDLLHELREAENMSVVIVSHDLSVIAGFADRVLVMYGGRLMEELRGTDLLSHSRHPYTRGLLRSHPDLEMAAQTPLEAIPGEPPDLARRPPGCPFAPRCAHRQDLCDAVMPMLVSASDSAHHRLACHFPEGPERPALSAEPVMMGGH